MVWVMHIKRVVYPKLGFSNNRPNGEPTPPSRSRLHPCRAAERRGRRRLLPRATLAAPRGPASPSSSAGRRTSSARSRCRRTSSTRSSSPPSAPTSPSRTPTSPPPPSPRSRPCPPTFSPRSSPPPTPRSLARSPRPLSRCASPPSRLCPRSSRAMTSRSCAPQTPPSWRTPPRGGVAWPSLRWTLQMRFPPVRLRPLHGCSRS